MVRQTRQKKGLYWLLQQQKIGKKGGNGKGRGGHAFSISNKSRNNLSEKPASSPLLKLSSAVPSLQQGLDSLKSTFPHIKLKYMIIPTLIFTPWPKLHTLSQTNMKHLKNERTLFPAISAWLVLLKFGQICLWCTCLLWRIWNWIDLIGNFSWFSSLVC